MTAVEAALRQELADLRRINAELQQQLSECEHAAPDELHQLFTTSHGLLGIGTLDGYFKHLSPGWWDVLGFTTEELTAEPFLNFVHPDDRDATIAAAQGLAQGREAVGFTNRYRTAQGAYRWLEWTALPSVERQLMYLLARDITETTQAEAQQRRTEERLRHTLHASRVVLYSAHLDGTLSLTFISENVLEQFGYEAGEILASPTFWLDRIHPEDVPRVVGGLREAAHKERHECDYRFRHRDGSYRWVHDELRVRRDPHGDPTEITGSCQDITERRQAELMIQMQAEALTELSTPLIPISDRVLAMPLIGTMDTRRAHQVMETLLNGITARRAEVAILDVTGVAGVDTHVANALLRVAKAAKLLGAEVVLTGIRPEVAQTLVMLGTDLEGIVTRGNLQAGIEYATHRK